MSTTIIAPTTCPVYPASVQSVSLPYYLDTVLLCEAVNPAQQITEPCLVNLYLSPDNVRFFLADTKRFKSIVDVKSFELFILSDYAIKPLSAIPYVISGGALATTGYAPQPSSLPWTNYLLEFRGNKGGSVVVSAVGDSGTLAPCSCGNMPAFTSFDIAGQATVVEVGTTIGGMSETFEWTTSYPTSVAANSISIVDTTASNTLASGLANTGSDVIVLGSITNTSPASQVWTINGVNTSMQTFSDTFSVAWEWRVYAGSNTAQTLTANQIKALSDSDSLQASFGGSYSITSGSVVYYYFSYPDSMGSVSAFVDGNTGFPISMATSADNAAYSNTANGWSYALVSVTNAQSVTTNYRVYRTQYDFSGTLLMKVS